MSDLISRQAAIDTVIDELDMIDHVPQWVFDRLERRLRWLSSAQSEIIRCKDCKYWNNGSCEFREHAVNCQDYMVGDIETEAEHFCGYAERRTDGID